ncbi:nuclear transport factor 2 family protein [Azohydromonas australica]|uniref:nuclear transport factor 2 family protein n=1 Tax=Azohydromonas australica TaxID=364039 RepID=UPI0004265ACE|nr:nuclear transport factor 2 family protein [Azohydromonas australica]
MTMPRKLLLGALVAASIVSAQAQELPKVSTKTMDAVRTPLNVDDVVTIENIKKLRVLYAHYLDTKNLEGLASLFTPDAVIDAGLGVWRGRDEIRTGLAAAFTDYDKKNLGSYPFMHPMVNQWVEITGSNSALGRCYLIDFATEREPKENPLLLLASYADEYSRIDGKWYINRSKLDIVWPTRSIGGGDPAKGLVLPK